MKIEKIINLGVTFLQVTLLVVLFVLEYLSGYKAGLAQHLYFKKISYISHYFQGIPLILQGILLLLLSAGVVVGCTRNGMGKVCNFWKYLILLTVLVICFYLPFIRELNVYAHLLLILELCMLFEVVGLILILRMHKENVGLTVEK